jgi:hypothetical protein
MTYLIITCAILFFFLASAGIVMGILGSIALHEIKQNVKKIENSIKSIHVKLDEFQAVYVEDGEIAGVIN